MNNNQKSTTANQNRQDGMQVKLDEVVEIIDENYKTQEEGEILEDTPIFEVVFRKEFEFQKYSETVVKLFKQHLVSKDSQLDFSTKTETNNDGSFMANIQAFETIFVKVSNENDKEKQNEDKNKNKNDIEKESQNEKDKDTEIAEENEVEIVKEKDDDEVVVISDDLVDSDQISNDSQDFSVELNNLFTIDPTPSSTLESAAVPSYKRSIKEMLEDKVLEKIKKPEDFCPRPKPNSSCFNCGATNHGLRDCTLPRSAKRINRAKKARSNKGERYHVDVDQRFAHLRPGVISEKLQKALRLRSGELPSFYYRMRVCGYPPGWLEDAKVSDSGLAMFNTGDDVLKSEESEVSKNDIKYDISKIIEFPGFNLSPGSGFYDDYKHYNVPPLSRNYMREEMITALGDSAIKGYKRKKMKDDAAPTNESSKLERKIKIDSHDMEIEDVDAAQTKDVQFTRPLPPPLPYSEENKNPPFPSESDSPSSSQLTFIPLSPKCSTHKKERSESPTLAELQERQRALLLKLECGDNFQNDNGEISLEISNCTNIPTENANLSIPTTPSTPTTPAPSDAEIKKIIKSSHMGTPVLQFSPFEKLPSGDNFKVGVSDVINFENLPDSTGKYESMKDVIMKVRNIKKQLNAEDD